MKILTKLLSNRLQRVITQIVCQNQYGFIKSRTVQDRVAWALEYLHLCHHSKKNTIVLKLDFEKAFDNMEHKAILAVLQHLSFGTTWLNSMKFILKSGASSVILNGIPGKAFHCKRVSHPKIKAPLTRSDLEKFFFLDGDRSWYP
jgi:hypothetical protein